MCKNIKQEMHLWRMLNDISTQETDELLPFWPKFKRYLKIGKKILLSLISTKTIWQIFRYGVSKRWVQYFPRCFYDNCYGLASPCKKTDQQLWTADTSTGIYSFESN